MAQWTTGLAVAASLLWLPALGGAAAAAIVVVVMPWAAVQIARLERFKAAGAAPKRIDHLMMLCLTYILLSWGFPCCCFCCAEVRRSGDQPDRRLR